MRNTCLNGDKSSDSPSIYRVDSHTTLQSPSYHQIHPKGWQRKGIPILPSKPIETYYSRRGTKHQPAVWRKDIRQPQSVKPQQTTVLVLLSDPSTKEGGNKILLSKHLCFYCFNKATEQHTPEWREAIRQPQQRVKPHRTTALILLSDSSTQKGAIPGIQMLRSASVSRVEAYII